MAQNVMKKHLPKLTDWVEETLSSPAELEDAHTPHTCINKWKSLIDDEFCLISPISMIHSLDQDPSSSEQQEYHYNESLIEIGEDHEGETETDSDKDDDTIMVDINQTRKQW
jgi:hypothetical protein